jgi:hypothetical protein
LLLLFSAVCWYNFKKRALKFIFIKEVKMKIKIILCYLVLAFFICINACDDSGGGGNGDNAVLNDNINIDLSTVKGFFISESDASEPAGLYAQYEDDTTGEINFLSDGSETTTDIYEFTQYILFAVTDCDYTMILCRKSDGSLFGIEGAVPLCGDSCGCYYDIVQADANEDALFIVSYVDGLFKIDITNPESPTVTTMVDGDLDGSISDMAVNSNGDVFVSVVTDVGSTRTFRIYKKNGGFFNVSSNIYISALFSGTGSNSNNFYYTDTDYANEIRQATYSSGNFTLETYASGVTFPGGSAFTSGGGSIVKTEDKVFINFRPGNGINSFLEAYNSADTPVERTVALFNRIDRILSYSDNIIILGKDGAGNGGLVRYNITAESFTTILAPGEYSISSVDVSASGEISFSGLRASDGARILANIPAGTTTVNIISTSYGEIIELERIN